MLQQSEHNAHSVFQGLLILPQFYVLCRLIHFTFHLISKTIYYHNSCKGHLFGIQDEAAREQINYAFDKDEV
jgi:hypothetical protein